MIFLPLIEYFTKFLTEKAIHTVNQNSRFHLTTVFIFNKSFKNIVLHIHRPPQVLPYKFTNNVIMLFTMACCFMAYYDGS